MRAFRDLVHTDCQIVARDASRWHAHRDGIELAAYRIENGGAKSIVGGITPVRVRHLPAGSRIDGSGNAVDRLAHVHQRYRAHIAARQLDRHRATYAARGTGDYRNLACNFH